MKSLDKSGAPVQGAKEAMADFYQELLGSLDKSPLDRLLERDLSVQAHSSAPSKEPMAASVETYLPKSFTVASAGSSELRVQSAAASSRIKPLAESRIFTEAPAVTGVLSSPVLQGAMPKLAPASLKPELSEKKAEAAAPIKKTDTRVDLADNESVPLSTDKLGHIKVVATRKGTDAQSRIEPQEKTSKVPGELFAPVSKKNLEWHANGRPVWAQERFECLLFSVAGLTLAVPLISLGAIYQLEGELTPLVGRANWFMGLYRHGERNVHVVDTAQWVMPDRWTPDVRNNYRFVIRLADDDWGVATDSVQQAINLSPEQVKWRSERSKRPWLAGTVIDHMCALLDADRLGELLSQDAFRRRR